ncbi:MAG: DEAD/DEAH box helicase, partial [Myxococcales bacterium]|nr:DEAD/DEAH box helicase [Myxococcales bacterium]
MQDTHEQDTHEHDSDLESRPIDDDSEDEQTTPSITFRDLGLSDSLLFAIGAMGWQYPSDVQAAAVPAALEGRDLIVQARTGSGKTGAFCIPIIQSLINPDLKEPQALVLCPTRELALQVATEAEKLAQESPIATLAVYGGAAMGPQVQAFKDGAQFISGSPGRVLDHLKRRTFKPDNVRVLVLDEADEMLSMGFLEEINAIIERLPEDRQMMLFSATIPKEIERLADRYQDDPVTLKLSEDFVGVREIDHIYYMISGGDRQQDLLRVLAYENPQAAIIFCNTRSDTAGVANFLAHQGFAAEGISSDLTQRERERVMKRMRDGELRFLVATDVAARGIDIDDVTHVINYTFPESADVYVHRTGRTGRAGKSGVAVSLVSPREIGSFYYLRLIHKISPEERHMPTAVELATRREAELYEQLVQRYGQRETTDEMRRLARRVLSTPDGEALIGHALVEALAKEKAEPTRSTTRRTRSRSSERSERRERDDRSDRSDRDDREDRPERAERAERAARSDGDGDSSEGDG